MKDYYQILGVSKTASTDEIKRAYRKLAHQHHPDKGGEANRFKEINEAYQTLSDPQKRSYYDQFGTAGPGAGFGSAEGFGRGFEGFEGFDGGDGGFSFSFGGGGLGDIFEGLFSQAFSTIQAAVEISPAQAVLGDELHLKVGNEKVDFKIPPGTADGTQFRFRGKGRSSRRGQGDLIIAVKIQIPQRLSKEERELWEKLKEQSTRKRSWFGL